jgi:hypothetical protein
MHRRTVTLALSVLPLLAVSARAQDVAPPPQNSSRTDLFIGFGGQSHFGNADAGWRPSVTFNVDVNVTNRFTLVVVPALGVGVSSESGNWVDYAFLTGPRFRFGGTQRVTPFVQALAGLQHGMVAPPNGVAPSPAERGTAFLLSFGGGMDVALNPRFAWRAIQFDEHSQFGDVAPFAGYSKGAQYAVSTGIVIRFGSRK